MKVILDIDRYLQAHPGEHAICGGTMDPPTLGHCENIANALAVAGSTDHPLIVNPHSRNATKNPISLDIRRILLIQTMRDYFGDSAKFILCCDPINDGDQERWKKIRLKYSDSLLAVEGISPDDVEAHKVGRLTRTPRESGVTATQVRTMIHDGDTQSLRYAVTPSIFRFFTNKKGSNLYTPQHENTLNRGNVHSVQSEFVDSNQQLIPKQ